MQMNCEKRTGNEKVVSIVAMIAVYVLIGLIAIPNAIPISAPGEATQKVNAVEDSYVSSTNPSANYNSYNQLRIGTDISGDNLRTYLKFSIPDTVTSTNILEAKLFMSRTGGNGVTNISVYHVADDSWSESAINWNNKPGYDIPSVNNTWVNNSTGGNSTPSDSWKVFDITNAVLSELSVGDRTLSLMLRSDELILGNYQLFNSREISSYAPFILFSFSGNAPVISEINIPSSSNEGIPVSMSFTATDPGGAIDSYRIYKNEVIVSNTSSYSWTPNFEEAGPYTFKFEVNNTAGISTSEERIITILNVPNLVINEFVSVPAYDWNGNTVINNDDEWIELYNPTSQNINITGWTLEYSYLEENSLVGTIPAHGFGTLLNPYGDLDNSGERILLKNKEAILVDRVYYGTYGSNLSANAPAPLSGYSAGRKTDGYDTDNDANDFMLFASDKITFNSSNNGTGSGDTTPPNAPLVLTANYANGNILLKWNAPAGEAVARYNIYSSSSNNLSTFNFAVPTAFTSLLNWTDTTASSAQKRFYIVRAQDAASNEEKNTFTVGKFDVQLAQNWNLISLPLNLTIKDLGQESVYGNPLPAVPNDCLVSIWRYGSSGFESSDYYAGYGWYPTLSPAFTKLEAGRGYWLLTNKACKITLTGKAPETISQNIITGWNLFGWYSLKEPTLGQVSVYGDPLATVPAEKLQTAWRYNSGFESTDYYAGYGWYPTLSPAFTKLEAGRGYWLYASQSCQLTTTN